MKRRSLQCVFICVLHIHLKLIFYCLVWPKMHRLTWKRQNDKSVPIAVAREVGKPSNYHVAWCTPMEEGEGETADVYISSALAQSGGARLGEVGAKRKRDGSTASASAGAGRGSEVVVDFEDKVSSGTSKMSLPPGKWEFEPVPPPWVDKAKEAPREIIFVSGRSGSGKSHWIRTYAQNYLKIYPENKVLLISSLKEDRTLDALDALKRIDVEKLAASPPSDVKTWKDSLVIIDDVEDLPKDQAAVVATVETTCAMKGRHPSVTLIRAAHNSTNYRETRLLLQEAHGFVVYPNNGTTSQAEYLLSKYGGLSKQGARDVMHMPTRWVYVHHAMPRFMMTANSLQLM